METDSVFSWLFIATCLVALVVRRLIDQTERSKKKRVFRFWQQVGLPMATQEIHDSLGRRLQRSINASFWGGLVGTLVAACQLWFWQGSLPSYSYIWLIALPGILIGITLFDVIVTLRDTLFGQRVDVPRMARAQALRLDDYISPWRLRAAPLLLLLAVTLSAVALLLAMLGLISFKGLLSGANLPFLLLTLIICSVCAVAANKLLQQPQPVSEKLELAWDDAVRADTIRKLAQLATLISWFALAAVGITLLGELEGDQEVQLYLAFGQTVAMVVYSVIVMMFSYGSSYSYFRSRLWPEITPSMLTVDQDAAS